ncbi:ATP-binding cassette domain-containing protein [Paenibacillus albiflavus]|uniref:ATP-binding cassette domain-containing protein n=1 Tax=Paenibacillus albiflavus TaxID=2545760 RepID=A0A4R4ECJ8_9BACL|nr:ATP-binding cassette domain-containing protein [Paenibacillus albiflavus]TCZ77107.1 ATP-binding cassette domain-containing protein [Paenibacillus albiflavus]
MSILDLQQLGKYRTGGERVDLFREVSAQINKPEMITVLGASGQGKSTLLRIMAKLDLPDEGEVFLHNKSANDWSSKEWRMKVCYIAQQAVMLPGTVEDNLRTVSELHRTPFEEKLATRLMEELGLGQLDWKQNADLLSGGEKQRVALIRSLLLHPEILLLDEVTASLDSASKQAVESMLKKWHKANDTTQIWITHDLDQARQIGDRVWFIGGGTLLEDKDSHSFFECPSSELGRQYLQLSEREVESSCL